MEERNNPIIVCGHGRSGTTMMINLLGCHNRIDKTGELTHPHLQYLIDYMKLIKNIVKDKSIRNKWIVDNERLYYKKMLEELWCFTRKKEFHDRKKRLAHKTPRAENFYELYNEIFYDSKPQYIYCLRNGISVITSFKNLIHCGKWKRKFDINYYLATYKESLKKYLDMSRDIAGSVLLVKFDNIVNTEEAHISFGQDIMNFIGEEMDYQTLDFLKEWKIPNPSSKFSSELITLSDEELEIIQNDHEFLELQSVFGY